MPILNFRVSTYSRNIYLYGTTSFSTIPEDYREPVKQYAAIGIVNGVQYPANFTGYTREQIDNALAKGYITQQEYDETVALVPAE
ncbi:MAG TPA: hypothetical protein VEG39_01845 [Clostridia bacterium]|nr:hypothetical protein [Clostridia bacterium]